MKKLIGLAFVTFLLFAPTGSPQEPEARDLYKPIVERLESLETMQVPEWPYHEDMAHPEDPSVSEVGWPALKVREEWKTGPRVFRRTIEIPEKINGYAVLGARVKLELFFGSNDSITISVFSNGSLGERTDEMGSSPFC